MKDLRDKINGWLDRLAGLLGIHPEPVPIPIKKRPRGQRK